MDIRQRENRFRVWLPDENLIGLKHPKLTLRKEAQIKKNRRWDFPGGAVVKNPPANAGDSIPGPGRSHVPRSN